jgi:hypothetical protein
MVTPARTLWKLLRRSLAANLGGFAGGSSVTGPIGLLAVEQERLATLQGTAGDASPPKARSDA